MKSVQWNGDPAVLEKLGMTDMNWFPCEHYKDTILVRALDGDYHCLKGHWITKRGKNDYIVTKEKPVREVCGNQMRKGCTCKACQTRKERK